MHFRNRQRYGVCYQTADRKLTSNPNRIGIIHLSLFSLCALRALERLNSADTAGNDIIPNQG